MSENPLATEAQRRIEDRAMALLERDDLRRTRDAVAMLWKTVTAWPAEDQADRFDAMIEEYMFHNAMRAANGDANDPHAIRFMAPEHHWFGRRVPGSRWGGDSPDFVYRTIPVGQGGRFEIHGRATCAEPPTVNYSLMSDNTASPVTQQLLDSLDMEIASDGSFIITVDDTPANGRPNHIQTRAGSDFIMVRDALGDWATQSANALTVTRLDPSGPGLSEDAIAAHCDRIARDLVYYSYYVTRTGYTQAPNHIREPRSAGAYGGMASQYGCKGYLWLDEDEAFLVRCNAAGAQFRNLVLTDAFHLSLEYWNRTASFNNSQMAPDEDGTYTFVVARQDPGVHNWLDTCTLRRIQFGCRWQAFVRGDAQEDPWMNGRLVKLDQLERELPDGVRRLDAAGRAAQRAAREASFARRF